MTFRERVCRNAALWFAEIQDIPVNYKTLQDKYPTGKPDREQGFKNNDKLMKFFENYQDMMSYDYNKIYLYQQKMTTNH